jgi:hypothetical protein
MFDWKELMKHCNIMASPGVEDKMEMSVCKVTV